LRGVLGAGIAALVDLAMNEPPVAVTRELVYCRFPLMDGSDNPPWLLRAAIETAATLLRANVPTLVFCSGGMSRTPAVAACALARVTGRSAEECLAEVARAGKCDVSTTLWRDLVAAMAAYPT
jgi:protein-tyrosine phosphatase